MQTLSWETFLDAISESQLQDKYIKEIRNCDVLPSLLKIKTDKYTEEEFDEAHATFMDVKKPLIYTYFKDV